MSLAKMDAGSSLLAKLTLLLLVLALAWDATDLDLAVMRHIGTATGFPLRNEALWSLWLHDRGKQMAVFLLLVLCVMVGWPIGPWKRVSRPARLASVLAVLISTLAISVVKRYSLTSCPWDLQDFGGVASYVSHWAWGVEDGGRARCFPSGHASAALGFMSATLPFLTASDQRLQRLGAFLLLLVLAVGLVFGAAQTLRGAHYPSHTLWTAFICWLSGGLVFQGLQSRPWRRPAALGRDKGR